MQGFSKYDLRVQEGEIIKCTFLSPALDIMNLNFLRMGAHVSPQKILRTKFVTLVKKMGSWY